MFTSGEGNDGFCTGHFQVFGRENDVFLFVYLCQNEFVWTFSLDSSISCVRRWSLVTSGSLLRIKNGKDAIAI